MPIPNLGIPNFTERAQHELATSLSTLRFADTRAQRVLRRFSLKETCEFLGYERAFLNTWLEHPDGPKGETQGRERTLSVADIMKIRALASTRPKARRPTLYWRQPGDRLPAVCFSSQKGGSSKSLSAAHFAIFASLYYGLRVGVIDCDPQATASLYFADNDTPIASMDTETFTTFMGVPAPGKPPLRHSDERLNSFWQKTAWPGIRLMPGGAITQEADISMHFLARSDDRTYRRVYRLLRDALHRWDQAYQPKTRYEDLFDAKGRFQDDVFQDALYETFDLIVLDCAPSLSLAQLNAVVAADTLVVPQTMRGFDLSTLGIFLSSLNDYLRWMRHEDDSVVFADLPSYILPTIVSNNTDTDIKQVGELYTQDPGIVCPVFYFRSDAVANAAESYQSIYEYDAPKSRRQSAKDFTINANAVSEAILVRAVPTLPPRGFANEFIRKNYPEGMVPLWTPEDE